MGKSPLVKRRTVDLLIALALLGGTVLPLVVLLTWAML